MLSESASDVVQSGAHAHFVTINPDGSPHVTLAWTGLDAGNIVLGTLSDQRKLANVRSDPRVAISYETDRINDFGLREYLVVYGTAEVLEGGASELLQELAKTYLGPDVKFPPMPDPPPGFVTRVRVESVGGVGPWV